MELTMARLIALAVFLVNMPRANAFSELIDNRGINFSDPGIYSRPVQSCSYAFSMGRNSVTITQESGQQSSCVFSHTQRILEGSVNVMNATYIHFYTCSDGSTVKYWTTFFGRQLSVRYLSESNPEGLDCR
jgi:hypothetical protein